VKEVRILYKGALSSWSPEISVTMWEDGTYYYHGWKDDRRSHWKLEGDVLWVNHDYRGRGRDWRKIETDDIVAGAVERLKVAQQELEFTDALDAILDPEA
jgi:hypothetical protein